MQVKFKDLAVGEIFRESGRTCVKVDDDTAEMYLVYHKFGVDVLFDADELVEVG